MITIFSLNPDCAVVGRNGGEGLEGCIKSRFCHPELVSGSLIL